MLHRSAAMRALVCGGGELHAAVATLGLVSVAADADLVLVDLRDSDAIAAAAAGPRDVPRIFVADADQEELVAALGLPSSVVARRCDAASIGPLVAALRPRTHESTRVIVATSARGGVGTTLLATNLAARLARMRSVVLLDITGTGAAAWWCATTAPSWRDLEPLATELAPEHLSVVAATAAGMRVVGGAGPMPCQTLAAAGVRSARELANVVVIDAPPLANATTRTALQLADRVLVLTQEDAASSAALAAAEPPEGAWTVAVRERARRAEDAVFFTLPRDDNAVSRAMRGDRRIGGALGRAYDELAEIVACDVTE